MDLRIGKVTQSSSRILYDIPCRVCFDHSSGKHYSQFTCDGCSGFFKRSVRRNRQYVCRAKSEGGCPVDKTHRNQCRACRFKKCLEVGMNKDAVQHERGPRNSTLRRQMSLFFKDSNMDSPPSSNHISSTSPLISSTDSSSPLSTPHSHSFSQSIEDRLTPPSSNLIKSESLSPPISINNQMSLPTLPISIGNGNQSIYHQIVSSSSNNNDSPSSHPFGSSLLCPPMDLTIRNDPRLFLRPPIFHPIMSMYAPFNKYGWNEMFRLQQQHILNNQNFNLSNGGQDEIHQTQKNISGKEPFSFPLSMKVGSETLCETAARLLFMNVKWTKTVPAFISLPMKDQLSLLEESWRELFVLGASQFNLPIEKGLKLLNETDFDDNSRRQEEILQELKTCQDVMAKFREMSVDYTEYAYLRAILVFRSESGDLNKSLKESRAISNLQDQAQLTLSKYINATYPSQPFRFGKLLLLLPLLRSVSTSTIEELFFRKTIGRIPIERIICDMYKSDL